jgi:catechol-2,3-dioxygenase
MAIQRVESMMYGADDVSVGAKYFEDWGLEKVESGAKGAVFRTASNQIIQILHTGDPNLPTAPDGRNTMCEATWGVDSKDALEKLGAELSKDRQVRRDADGAIHSQDETGFPIAFRVANRAPTHAKRSPVNLDDQVSRINHEVDRDKDRRAAPLRIGHIVYAIPKEGREKAQSFYLDRLGFKLTDRSLDLGDFMRTPGVADHHCLFLLHAANVANFNHVAFEVQDFDELMVGGAHMKNRGWKPVTTPGRHMVGSNLFWYFQNPCGGRNEYFADMDRMDDSWTPKVHEKHPGWAVWEFDAN